MQYRIIKTNRKSVALQVKNGEVIVRAPFLMKEADIEKFVLEHRSWIEKRLEMHRNADSLPKLSTEEINELSEKARKVIPDRVKYYAKLIGVTYGNITIRNQKTRWGSCSSKRNLNFNCLLMLTPVEVLDSVIVHELCHLKEMNHSKRFYDEVLKVCPDYYKQHKWLNEHGESLLRRMTGE